MERILLVSCGLVAGVVAGLVAHEGMHAAVLRAAGVAFVVEIAPDRNGTVLGLLASCPWALVRPLPTGDEPPWVLRAAALAPALLALPVAVLGATGSVDPSHLSPSTALAIGWLACAVPSPQDFSVAFHAKQLLLDDCTDPLDDEPTALSLVGDD